MLQIKNKKGDFEDTNRYLAKSLKFTKMRRIDEAAKRCVERLKEATPVDSGLAKHSWNYEIIRNKYSISIVINNTDIENGVNVVLLIEYGHATKNGTWIEGKNFIDPIVTNEYLNILENTWKEIKKL